MMCVHSKPSRLNHWEVSPLSFSPKDNMSAQTPKEDLDHFSWVGTTAATTWLVSSKTMKYIMKGNKPTAMNTFNNGPWPHFSFGHSADTGWTLVIHILRGKLVAQKKEDIIRQKSNPSLNATQATQLLVSRFLPFSNETVAWIHRLV